MEGNVFSRSLRSHSNCQIDLAALQAQINEQKRVLSELYSSISPIETKPSTDPVAFLQQIRRLTATYQSLTKTQPYLPSCESILPHLLALRVTARTNSETQIAISQSESSLQETTLRIQREKADLEDSKVIKSELSARIKSLQEEIKRKTRLSPELILEDKIRNLEHEKKYYDTETSNLMTAFYSFIDKYLGPMLAVEELGGPVVGQLSEIDDEILQSGFSNQGKVKKARLKEDKRQKRITQIWGMEVTEEDKMDEKSVAAAELKELTERLLKKMDDEEGESSSSYIKLRRESAAARFLVRSKVAQFHPTDSKSLRLIGFGSEISDQAEVQKM